MYLTTYIERPYSARGCCKASGNEPVVMRGGLEVAEIWNNACVDASPESREASFEGWAPGSNHIVHNVQACKKIASPLDEQRGHASRRGLDSILWTLLPDDAQNAR